MLRPVERLRSGLQLRGLPVQEGQVRLAIFGERSDVAALERGELGFLQVQLRFFLIELFIQEFRGLDIVAVAFLNIFVDEHGRNHGTNFLRQLRIVEYHADRKPGQVLSPRLRHGCDRRDGDGLPQIIGNLLFG